MWLIILTSNRANTVHSWHRTREQAEQWAACKRHDNEDVLIAAITPDQLKDLAAELDLYNSKHT